MRNADCGLRIGGLKHAVWTTLFILLSSCGYHLTSTGGLVPPGAKSIAVPVLVNGTNEPYVDTDVTQAIVEEFLSDGRLEVVGSESADLVLQGRVTYFEITPTVYTTTGYVASYNVKLSVTVSLIEAKTQKVLLKDQGFSSIFFASYGVTLGDITSTKIAKDAALKKASADIAASIRSRVLEGF